MAIKKKKNYNEILYELQKQAVLNKTGAKDEDLKKQAAKQDFAQLRNYSTNANTKVNPSPKKSNLTQKTTTKSTKTTKDDKKTWFSGGAFSDGYDFGDVTKTILGTTGDAIVGAGKGVFNIVEGVGDAVSYGVAGIADLFGADDYADDVRKQTSKNLVGDFFKPAEDALDKYSVLGEKSDSVAEGLGYIGAIIATGGAAAGAGLGTVGTTAVTTGLTGVSSFGSGTSQAYQSGATDGEAHLYGLISGVAEAGTEMIFGGLGKTINAVGISKGLSSADDMLAKKISSKFSNQLAKNLTEYTIKAGAEGTEEVMAGLIQGIGKKITYMSEEELAQIIADEELLDQFIVGAVTSGIAQTPSLIKANVSGTDFIQSDTQETQSDTQKNISNQITELESQLDTSMNAGQQQEVLDQINTLKEQYDVETENIAKQEQAERELRRTNFTYDETKITDEVEKTVYESASKYFNNTARSHEFVERVAKISKDKGTRYSFINNEELKTNGLDVEGKQVNGLVRTEQDGKSTILINIDSPKALNTIVGHETTHLLEGTKEYQELQQSIFEYAKTKGDLDTIRENLTELYKDIENADIDSELTAELVGDYLFTDSKFIDSLAVEKPTLFQKIKDLIDDLVVRFKGTKEERQLREVQKAFRNAYSVSNSNNIDTKYALTKATDEQISKAEALESQNKTAEEIYLETGAYRGADDRWKTEIDDSESEILLDVAYIDEGETYKLEQLLKHDKLYKAYPGFKSINVKFANNGNYNGMFNPNTNIITIDPGLYNRNEQSTRSMKKFLADIEANDPVMSLLYSQEELRTLEKKYREEIKKGNSTLYQNNLKSTLMHEIQHLIQEQHTFAKGSNLESKQRAIQKYNEVLKEKDAELVEYYDKIGVSEWIDENIGRVKSGEITIDQFFEEQDEFKYNSQYGEEIRRLRKEYQEYRDRYTVYNRSAYDLYENTAGEIEARQVQERLNLTPEQRRSKMPFVKDEKTVYDEPYLNYKNNVSPKRSKDTAPVKGNTKYSISDNQGRTLTKEQQEHFKDVSPELKDENGNLKVLYHGSDQVDTTVFTKDKFGNRGVTFLTDDPDIADTYRNKDGKRYELYANMKNPLVIDANGSYWSNIDYYGDGSLLATTDEIVQDALNGGEVDSNGNFVPYDGVIFKNVIDRGKHFHKSIGNRTSTIYVTFDSNQIKNIDNISPTKNNDIRYSLTDNQGRELSKEQQEYFKDSKVRDSEGRLLEVYHGTPNGEFTVFDNEHESNVGMNLLGEGFYFTSLESTADEYSRLYDEFDGSWDYVDNSKVYKTYLNLKNPFVFNASEETLKSALNKIGINLNKNTLKTDLINKGYDGIIEHTNYVKFNQIVAFEPNQIKNIDNTNPTSDADIRYSLTPEYGMQHRPSTDYGDASNFEENMPDVFEHPEWYMFGGDDWYKKSYRESLNALRKVRNNPDGEITIYRATIGDTFNEGDWVSPSKTYAEWHNYSNLDGKGKVIELKVKAKDIRFAGDDLNEFGYFPNGVDEYSLSKFNEQRAEAKGNYNVYGEDVKLQVEEAIAPLQEKIEVLTERLDTVVNATEQVSTQPTKAELDNLMALQETGGTEYANEFFRLRDKYGQPKLYKGINEYKKAPSNYGMIEEGNLLTESDLDEFYKQSSEEFNKITDEDAPMPMEDTTPDYEYEKPTVESPLYDRNIDEVGSRKVKAYQYEHPEVRPYFQEAALGMMYDLKNTIKGERIYNDEVYYNTNGEQGWMGVKRHTTDDIADLLDNFNHSYADIEKGLNAILEDNGAENIAVAKRIEFALDERLRNGYIGVDGLEIPANQEYIDLLREKEFTNYYNSIPGNDIAPLEMNLEENSVIVPETKNVAENTLKTSHEEIVAKPETTKEITNEVKKSTNPIKPKTKGSTRDTLNYLFVNRNEAIDRFAKETGNNNIKFLADHVNNVSGEISTNINKAQIDNNGKVIGKGIVNIFNQARDAKLTEAFDDYLFHLSNKARHKQGKGSLVPLTESESLINEYEKAYPEMKEWAKEVNQYNRNNLYKQVDAGLYSKELADSLVEKYEFYVPFFGDVLQTYTPSKSKGIKTRGTVRLAEGGANRNLLSFEEAMIKQTQSAITAIRKNQLYQEIVESSPQVALEAEVDANGLYVDDGGYYLTAKYDGENLSAYISEDLYRGLENRLGQEIRNIEEKLSGITKPLQAIGNIRRNILTTWSPSFIITNPAKDIQDAPLNSKYAKDWALNYPKAMKELTTGKGEHLQEFLNMYGEAGIMGDYVIDSGVSDVTKVAKTKKKLGGINRLNEMLELAPRYAEYLASIKNGASQMEALYNAREVTTNFGRGGVITKALNRNGFTFLNASVQGFNKLYRNFSGENGAKGVVNASLKALMFGVAPALFNALSYDDDEDYEALPDYIKDNYYLYKTDDGEFIRIPKGRMMSIFGSAARRALEAAQGEENAFEGYLTNAYSQVGIQNPMESNIFAPLLQAYGSKNGKTWYGTDLVPTRLQDVPAAEQYDESTDKFSIWLGKTFGISPYKVNYVFDQYSGGLGDLLLPTITEEANSDGSFLAPLKDKFVVNSTMDNKYASEFYTKRDKLQVNANSMYATEEDTLMSMYMDEMSWDMSSLYKEKREVQNSDLSKKEKYERVQEIQQQINDLAKEALNTYDTGTFTENYASIGNYEFYKGTDYNGNEEWKTVYDYKVEELAELGMTSEEKNKYFALKQEFDALNNEYYDAKDNLESTYGKRSDEFEDGSDELYMEKKNTIIDTIMASGLTDDAKAYLYKEYYNSSDIDTITMSGIAVDYFLDYQKNDFKADYNSKGKAIPNSRKNKVIDYVNEFDLSIPEKAIIIKSTNTFKFNDYNDEIVSYVADLDITEEDKIYILEELGMTVDDEGFAHWSD